MRYAMGDPRIAWGPSRLDWIIRYEPVLDWLLQADQPLRWLDFGCGPVGLGSVYTGPFLGIDAAPVTPQVPNLTLITGVDPLALDLRVDGVSAMDVLEHLSPADRPALFRTLRRVSMGRVFVSYPTADGGRALDIESLAWFGPAPPDWLIEHLAWPHPATADVAAWIDAAGFRVVSYCRMTPRTQHALGCVLGSVAGLDKALWLNECHAFRHFAWPADVPCYRDLWILEVPPV